MKNFIFNAKKLILAALLGVVIAPTYAQEASVILPPSSEVEISIDSASEKSGEQKTFVHRHKSKIIAAVLAATATLGGGVILGFIIKRMFNNKHVSKGSTSAGLQDPTVHLSEKDIAARKALLDQEAAINAQYPPSDETTQIAAAQLRSVFGQKRALWKNAFDAAFNIREGTAEVSSPLLFNDIVNAVGVHPLSLEQLAEEPNLYIHQMNELRSYAYGTGLSLTTTKKFVPLKLIAVRFKGDDNLNYAQHFFAADKDNNFFYAHKDQANQSPVELTWMPLVFVPNA